jgi:MFS transporter, ACS family, glucarate transporter
VGGFLRPIILAYVVQHFANWMAPLYVTGGLYFFGGLCWLAVNPTRPIWKPAPVEVEAPVV